MHLNSLIQGGHGKVISQKEIVAENLLYEEGLTGRVGPKNLGQILEKVQNCLKCLAKISKKSEILIKFLPCSADILPNIDLIDLKPFPINFYGQFASKRGWM